MVKVASKCSKTDSNSQNISAALKPEPRGALLSGPLNTGLARSTFVLLTSLPGKLLEEVAREPPAFEQYSFTLTFLVISGKQERSNRSTEWELSHPLYVSCSIPLPLSR